MQGNGIDVRPMQSIYQFPTLVIFAEGKGIATAKALIETSNDANGLDLNFRQDVRLYYRVRIFSTTPSAFLASTYRLLDRKQ